MSTEVESLFEIPESLLVQKYDNVYTTSAHDFHQFQDAYKCFPLPNNILFPWLHGVDGFSNQQNLFFGVRRSMVPNYRGLMVIHCNEIETTSRLVESVLPLQVVDTHGHFLNNVEVSINLRNFQNQIARFATLCDIVVYGNNAQAIAQIISSAQTKLFQERQVQIDAIKKSAGKRAIVNANNIIYKTIIIENDFSVFEQNYPELVMCDSTGLTVNRRAFWELENIQMKEMSGASEITKNVWIGNTQDVPISVQDIKDTTSFEEDEDDDFPALPDDNPHHFSICIESHDLADMPLPSTLTLARETLNDLKDKQMPSEIIHFDMYATGVPQEKTEFDAFYSRLLHLLKFMQDQANRGRNILIHCSDGYTETSLLGLTWTMYHLKITLPEAYLYLQKKRSFFVYAADVPTLRRIEHLIFGQDEILEPQAKRKKSEQYDCIQKLEIKSAIPVYDSDFSDEDDEMDDNLVTVQHSNRLLQSDAYINQISNNNNNEDGLQGNVYKQMQLCPTKEEERLYPWFYSPRFEGSFPSRILPFLYLGNLNHATNPEMLKALNITHVVSVGENADLNGKDFELLFLDNLYDDGIDSIRGRLDTVMEFVEDARLKGTTCLIHCRVGVSRSAAITICYVMKHLKYTLMQAYLFVRARRLNVIIQPNLKFMYEMLQLEQRETGTITITWPTLCNEIFNLNFSYRDTSCSPS